MGEPFGRRGRRHPPGVRSRLLHLLGLSCSSARRAPEAGRRQELGSGGAAHRCRARRSRNRCCARRCRHCPRCPRPRRANRGSAARGQGHRDCFGTHPQHRRCWGSDRRWAAEAKAQASSRERLAELAIQRAEREQREAAAQDSSDPYDPYSEGPLARWRQNSRDGRLPSSHSDDSDDDAPSWVHDNMR